jgi:hypothetical protein
MDHTLRPDRPVRPGPTPRALEGTADASRLRRRTTARRAARPDRGTQLPPAALICRVAGRATGCGQRRLGGTFAAADHALDSRSPTATTNDDRGLLFPAAAWLTRAVQPGRSRVVVLGASLAGLFAALQFAPKAPPIKGAQRIRGPPPYRHRCRLDDRERAAGRRHWGGAADGSRRTPGRPSGTVRPGRSDPRRADSGLR